MPTQARQSGRFNDMPRDKPIDERTEHANLERPGAQAHPKAANGWAGWDSSVDAAQAWKIH